MLKKNLQFIFRNTTVEQIFESLQTYPHRFRKYHSKKSSGIWKIEIIAIQKYQFLFQLVDTKFEPPRGNVKSDAPYIYLALVQKGDDVVACYALKWQTWKVLLTDFIFLLSLATSAGLFLEVLKQPSKNNIGTMLCSLLIVLLIIIWFVRNRRHDFMTMLVFRELLEKINH